MNSISEGYGVDQTAVGSDWSEPAVSVRPSRLGRQARAERWQQPAAEYPRGHRSQAAGATARLTRCT
jgi:hypothetical protein